MTNIYRPVDGDTILPERLMQGQPWRNISFGASASAKDYGLKGLYLEVGAKPMPDEHSVVVLTGEKINHTTKQIELSWEVQPMAAERVAEMIRLEDIKTEKDSSELKGITVQRAKDIINDRFQLVRDMPDAGATAAATAAALAAKLDALILTCAWVDRQEAKFILE